MLKITIPKQEYWNARTQEFVQLNAVTLRLEHSLVSLSKWEMKWHVPFFGNDSLTREQMVDYVRCMTITQGVEPSVYLRLTESNMAAIYKYMDEPMTATWFPGEPKPCEPRIPQKSKPRPKIKVKVKALTCEAIYARMFAANIPLECEKWHLNRLFTLIRVCNEERKPPKKMSKSEALSRQRALNEKRLKEFGTRG